MDERFHRGRVMYILPRNYECFKCNFSFIWGPHEGSTLPYISYEPTEEKHHPVNGPVCPQCWNRFLVENIGYGIMAHQNNNE